MLILNRISGWLSLVMLLSFAANSHFIIILQSRLPYVLASLDCLRSDVQPLFGLYDVKQIMMIFRFFATINFMQTFYFIQTPYIEDIVWLSIIINITTSVVTNERVDSQHILADKNAPVLQSVTWREVYAHLRQYLTLPVVRDRKCRVSEDVPI